MGLDFLERSARSFKKAVSRDAEAVARMSASLRGGPDQRIVVADCAPNACLSQGQVLIVRQDCAELALIYGLYEVARVRQPPSDVLRRIEDLGGFGEAHVEHINTIGGTCDVALH